jgi:hypothetical protein
MPKASAAGRVDITSGKFVFSCTEAYRIRGGKIAEPVKGATLIGDGPSVLTRVKGIGNDMALDEGVGICGKGGQSVPAGVGQPTLLIDGLTVGGRQREPGRAGAVRYRGSKRTSPGWRLEAEGIDASFLMRSQQLFRRRRTDCVR